MLVRNASRAALRLLEGERPLDHLDAVARASSSTTERVTPPRISGPSGRVIRRPSPVDDVGIRARALGDAALRVEQPDLAAAGLGRLLPRQDVGQQAHRLDVAALPALVGQGDNADTLREFRRRWGRRRGGR